jgi:hypothetical protein
VEIIGILVLRGGVKTEEMDVSDEGRGIDP